MEKKKIQDNIVFYFVITVDLQYRPLNSVGYSISLRYFQTLQHVAQREGGELIRQVQTILLTAFIHVVVPIKIYVVDVFFDMSPIYIYMYTHKPANVNTEYVIHIYYFTRGARVRRRTRHEAVLLDIKATTHTKVMAVNHIYIYTNNNYICICILCMLYIYKYIFPSEVEWW